MFEYGRRPDVIGPVFEIMAYKAQPEEVQHYVIVFANDLLSLSLNGIIEWLM